jgi:Flp pilus assembly protein TadG
MKRRRQSGQSLVEFALIAPILFIVVLGLVDGTRAVFAYNSISNAAREGARYGIVHGSTSSSPVGPGVNENNLRNAVRNYTKSFSSNDVTITPTWPGGGNATGSKVKVDVAYSYKPVFGGIMGIGSFTMHASATMVIQN